LASSARPFFFFAGASSQPEKIGKKTMNRKKNFLAARGRPGIRADRIFVVARVISAPARLRALLPGDHAWPLEVGPCARCGGAPSTVRPLARDPRVLMIGWPFPLGFGLDGRLLLARRGRVYV